MADGKIQWEWYCKSHRYRHLKMFMNSYNATVPQTMIWSGQSLGGQLLDHQYGSAACAGIARRLQHGSRKGKSEGFLQDLQPKECTAWNSQTEAWEQVSEPSSPCTYRHGFQTYTQSHNTKVQTSCFHFGGRYTYIKGRGTSLPRVG